MTAYRKVFVVIAVGAFASAMPGATERLSSPSGDVSVSFETTPQGMFWSLSRKGATIVGRSPINLDFIGAKRFGEMAIVSRKTHRSDSTWTNRLYRREVVRDRYGEMELHLKETTQPCRELGIVFRRMTKAWPSGTSFRNSLVCRVSSSRAN